MVSEVLCGCYYCGKYHLSINFNELDKQHREIKIQTNEDVSFCPFCGHELGFIGGGGGWGVIPKSVTGRLNDGLGPLARPDQQTIPEIVSDASKWNQDAFKNTE